MQVLEQLDRTFDELLSQLFPSIDVKPVLLTKHAEN